MNRVFNVQIINGTVQTSDKVFYPFNKEKETLHTPERIKDLDRYYSGRAVNRVYDGHLDGCNFQAMYLMQADWSFSHNHSFHNASHTERAAPLHLVSDVLLLKKKIDGPSLRGKRGLKSWGLTEWNILMTEEYFTVSVERLL